MKIRISYKVWLLVLSLLMSCNNSLQSKRLAPLPTVPPQNELPLRPAHGSKNILLSEVMRSENRSDAYLLIQDGRILAEAYDQGYHAEMPHKIWSVSKTLAYLTLGAAVQTGRLHWQQSICDFLPLRDEKCQITLESLVTHSSGLHWKETYEKSEDLTASSVVQMLFGDGRLNMMQFILQQALIEKPGSVFRYSTGDTTLLMAVLRQAFPEWRNGLAWRQLFHPLGVESLYWETDPQGNIVGGAGAYATARDLGRIGQLMLNEGRWKDQQLLPSHWMKQGTEASAAFRNHLANQSDRFPHGATLWLNQDVTEQNISAPFQEIDRDVYWAWGHWGQFVAVFPSLGAVAVRLGNDRNDSSQILHSFLNASQNFLKNQQALQQDALPLVQLASDALAEDGAVLRKKKYRSSQAKIGANSVAHELCSCLFVVGQSRDYCHGWVREGLPLEVPYEINWKEKRIKTFLPSRAIPIWTSTSTYVVNTDVANTSSCRAEQ